MIRPPAVTDDVIELDIVRIRATRERLATQLAERLSAIPCSQHGKTAVAVGSIDDQGVPSIRYPHGTCCPSHSALLHASGEQIERELSKSTGYLRSMLIAERDGED